jgi:hypothetical protein
MPLLLHVGRYLMTPPVLSGTTNVLDTGAPLGDWLIKSACLRTIPIWPFVLVPGVICSIILNANLLEIRAAILAALTIMAAGITAYFDQTRRVVVLMYDLDHESSQTFEKLTRAIDELRQASRIWNVEASGREPDWKRHAGATVLMSRSGVTVGYDTPALVKTNVSVPAITGGRLNLYFFPDLLMVVQGRTAGVVNYDHLSISTTISRFVESETVPPDSQVVSETWKYVNKKGGPDKRFNNNRQLPVVNYQEIDFSSSTGLHKILQVSRVEDRGDIAASVLELGKLSSAALAAAASLTKSTQAAAGGRHTLPQPATPPVPAPTKSDEPCSPTGSTALEWGLLFLLGVAVLLVFMWPVFSASTNSTALQQNALPNAATESTPSAGEDEQIKRAQENELLDEVRPIPSSNYEANLKIY